MLNDVLLQHGIGAGGSNVKSVQHGTALFNSTAKYINIETVDLAKAAVYISIKSASSIAYGIDFAVEADFYSESQLRLIRFAYVHDVIVYWTVIEFEKIKSFQIGRSDFSSLTNLSVPISEIDMGKSLLFYSCSGGVSNDQGAFSYIVGGKISTQTALYFESYAATSPVHITWFVVEFN